MNPLRNDLIALAKMMPEPALWTACEVLKAIKEAQAELDQAERDAAEASRDAPEQPPTNVLSFARHRNRRLENERGTARDSGTVPQAKAVERDLARLRGRVADGLDRISRLEEMIRDAQAKGQPTYVAQGLVDTFRRSIDLMQVHVERMAHPGGTACMSR